MAIANGSSPAGKAIPDLLAHLLSHCQNPAHRHLLVDGANHLSNEVRCADRLNPPPPTDTLPEYFDRIGERVIHVPTGKKPASAAGKQLGSKKSTAKEKRVAASDLAAGS